MQAINSLVFVYDGIIYATKSFAYVRNLMMFGSLVIFFPMLIGGFLIYKTLLAILVAKSCLNLVRCLGAIWLIEFHFRRKWKHESIGLEDVLRAPLLESDSHDEKAQMLFHMRPQSLKLSSMERSGDSIDCIRNSAGTLIALTCCEQTQEGRWSITLLVDQEKGDVRTALNALRPLASSETKTIMFCALERSLMPKISDVLADHGFKFQWAEKCGLWVLDSSSTLPKKRDFEQDGVRMVPLRSEHAPAVNDFWKYKSDRSLDMIKSFICGDLPCYGIEVRSANGEYILASWALTYKYGAIGLMSTRPEFRRRGFAVAVARKISSLLRGAGRTPFCYIVEGNAASERLFGEKLGFARVQSGVDWVGFRK